MLFTICQPLLAQEATWRAGVVVLASGEVLTGSLFVNARHDVLLYRAADADVCDVLPAHQFHYAQYYDSATQIHHKFTTLESESGWRLYEIIVKGAVAILRHQRSVVRTARSDAEDFHYYLHHRGNLYPLRDFYRHVFPELLVSGGTAFADDIEELHLDATRPADAIRIVQRYNALYGGDASLARY